jgi:hypothetical protein
MFKRREFHPETDPGSVRFHDYHFRLRSNGTIEFDEEITGKHLKCQMGDLYVVIEEEGVVKFVPTHLVPDKY